MRFRPHSWCWPGRPTIRGGETLGGWLHHVAYWAAVQANVEAKKQRRKEAEQRLKRRLRRRGFAAPALGAVLAAEVASAAVPPVLIRSTVLAATGGSASSGVVLLTHALMRSRKDKQKVHATRKLTMIVTGLQYRR
jgi:hypothetical protein